VRDDLINKETPMKQKPPRRFLTSRFTLRNLLLVVAAPVLLFCLVWNFTPPVASQRQGNNEDRPSGPENYDIRTSRSKPAQIKKERRLERLAKAGKKKDNRGQQMKAARARLAEQNAGVSVKDSDYMDAPEIVRTERGRRKLTSRSDEARERIVRRFLSANEDLFGLSPQQVARLRKRAEYTNPAGNLSWVSLEQTFNDIPVFQGELNAALTPEGELVQTNGTLAPDVEEKELSTSPDITAALAVVKAAETIGVAVNPNDLTIRESSPDGRSFVFSGGPFADDTKIELVYFPLDSGLVALAWSMTLWQDPLAYYIVVDAEDGDLFFRKNITDDQTQTATYVVYGSDSPAPLSPSLDFLSVAIPTAQGVAVPRTSFTLITEMASPQPPDPWLNDGATTTTGNNVDAGLDLVAPNGIDAASRAVSATRNFDFPYDPAPGLVAPGESPTLANYRFGEVVNMFFWTNRFHDRMYEIGFTEAARNFQQSNFGRNPGGATANAIAGNDRVLAEGQDFSGTSNANFATPADGSSGRMQMFIFDGPTPDRSSGIDQEILIHELTHGLSNRLHGNAGGLSFAQGGGMGEGWSDFYARALLSSADEDINGIYGAGGYSTLAITGPTYNTNYYYGIRRFPYALKTTVGANGKPHNPLTFADVDASKISLTDGAFPRGPIGSATAHQVHNVGEVWCMTLLEVRARLITRMGFAAGNQRMLQLVTDGMKLNPINPTILDSRNSILTASAASGGGALEEADIWAGFASRGMGFGATVSGATITPITVTESFDTPNLQLGTVTIAADSCDSAGFADPGESIELAVQLVNPLAGTDALGATAEIVGGGSASYGDIPGGGSATRNLSYTVPSSATCGEKITLTININSSIGPLTKTYVLQVGAPTSIGSAITAGTGNVAIPLPDVATTEIPITVTETGFVGDVNVRLRLNHTFDGDLAISLIAPDGTSVPLSNNRGGAGDNFGTGTNDCSGVQTVFDDSAATAISAGVAPFAATFRPETPLAALNGKNMNGVWKLRVADTGALDVGTLGCATLEITRQLYYCCGVAGTPIINAAPPATVVAESALPANNAPDPDETVTMSFPLKNVGTGLSTNLVATLQSGGGVNSPSGPQSYGVTSPVGPAVARNFTFVPSGNCGDNIVATFHLQDGAMDLGNVSFTIRLGTIVQNVAAPAANTTPLIFPVDTAAAGDGVGPATPFPSDINVSGLVGTVSKVTVTLTGIEHTFPSDIDVLLVGPQGQKMILLSDAGGGTDINNVTVTFDDAAAAVVPATIVSGTFRPTNITTGDTFPAPAPAGPYGATLSVFNGSNPNGTWKLYALDDAAIDDGTIAGGWSLTITTDVPVCVFSPCLLGVADITQVNDLGVCGAIVNFAPTVTGSCGVVTSAPPSGSVFAVGATPVVTTGTRQDSSTTTAGFNVTVNDTEQPTISNASANPSSLWLPNHKMVDVTISYDVADNCTAASAVVTSLSVTSNEPVNGTGDGDTAPDWQVVDAHHVRLRAERAGGGGGRIYSITITATDAVGNVSTRVVTVSVPHDRGN
jgi:extracellular elastinolytic metalloproteinase